MTDRAPSSADRSSSADRTAAGRATRGRALAAAAGTALLVTGLVGTAAAAPQAPSPAPSSAAADATPSPSPDSTQGASPTPSPTAVGNQPPRIDCPGVVTLPETREDIRLSVLDPDGDPVTLTTSVSMFGVETTVDGHVVTYTAPDGLVGQDSIPVTAADGRGGMAHCEIAVLVQSGGTPPTPTPTAPASTPVPEPTTSPEPTTPAPEPTSAAPSTAPTGSPTAGPTSVPAPSPTAASPSAPATGPTSDAGGNGGQGGQGGPGGNGSGPGAEAPGGSGSGDTPATGPETPSGSGPHGAAPDDVQPGGADHAGTGQDAPQGGAGSSGEGPSSGGQQDSLSQEKLGAVVEDTTVHAPLQALSNAERLIQGLSAGMASQPEGGTVPDPSPSAVPGEGATTLSDGASGQHASTEDGVERTAAHGSSIWLFTGVGALMVVLIGLAIAALPSRRGRH